MVWVEDLRDTFDSQLVTRGVRLAWISHQLGHGNHCQGAFFLLLPYIESSRTPGKTQRLESNRQEPPMLFLHWNEERQAFREIVRRFSAKEIRPNTDKWDADGSFSSDIFAKAGTLGLLGVLLDGIE